MGKTAWVLGALLLYSAVPARAATIQADQTNYKSLISTLKPGDTLVLAPGDYAGLLNIRDVHGTPDAWITIKGPDTGPQPRFLGDPSICCNTIEIRTGSYFALENLVIDGQNIDGVFGISAAGSDTHHVRIENCTIVGHGAHQQTVGISTKVTTWGWILRRNTIVAAGTGMYLGNSDGSVPFIGGLIEHNLFLDSKGYNMQIKHQNSRPAVAGVPTTPQKTIIRHNVFIKGTLPNEDGPRPNLLLGGFPDSGNGSSDLYEVYGNLFYHNGREALMQAEGRVVIHDNVFVDCANEGIYLTNHNKTLKLAHVYNNTFYAMDRALHFANAASEGHSVVGNLMFTDRGATGSFTNSSGNIAETVANATLHVKQPNTTLGSMDFYPLPGKCQGAALDLAPFAGHTDHALDFNGNPKGTATFRGAYAGEGTNPGWQLDDAIKGQVSSTTPPPAPPPSSGTPQGTVRIDDGAPQTPDLTVDLQLSITQAGAGMGQGAQMSFSNDNATWSSPEPFATVRADWPLYAFGGSISAGTKTVYARFRDVAGQWSSGAAVASVQYTPGSASAPAPVPGGGGSADPLTVLLLGASALVMRRRRSRLARDAGHASS